MRQVLLGSLSALVFALPAHAAPDPAEPPESIQLETGSGAPVTLTRIEHAAAAIKIDGRLDEAAWQGVTEFSDFRVIVPDTLAVPDYRTRVRLFHTDRGLYVGFDAEQPPDTIVRRFTPRDDFDVNRDWVSFTLDTSGSGRYGYWMNLSIGDVQRDGTVLPERQFSHEWDGAWYGATQTTAQGWSAEFFIPWSQMAMPNAPEVRRIGFYAQREVAHLNERWAYPALPDSQPRFMSALQPLLLHGVDPRQQWSVFPYVSSTLDRVIDDVRYKAGVDLFWRPSSNFQLTATAKPDFGSVESDDVVVNLTATETFFPEKRLFFQEGKDIFETTPRAEAGADRTFTIINTRRIGGRPPPPQLPPGEMLSPREILKVADLLGATKATGQLGSFRYGILGAAEDDTEFTGNNGSYVQDGRNFGAVRWLYEDSRGAAYRGIGMISTIVAHPLGDSVVHAADFHYLTTTGKWNFDGQFIYSDRDVSGTGRGATANIGYVPHQGLKHELELTAFDDRLNVNDLGFQTRNNNIDIWYQVEWVRSGLTRIRDFKLTPFLRYEVNGSGYRTNNAVASGYELTLNNLHKIQGMVAYFPQRYDDLNSFGHGTFTVAARTNAEINYTTDTSLPLSLTGKVAYRGEFVGGRTLEGLIGVSWRPRHNVNVNLQADYQDRDGWLLYQEDQNFTAFLAKQWQPEFSFEWFPSAVQQFRVALQWVGVRAREDEFYYLPPDDTDLIPVPKPPGPTDDFSISQLNFQIRYRWQIAPLSDLFIVYTKADQRTTGLTDFRRLFQDSWNNPLGDQLVIKLRYRLGS